MHRRLIVLGAFLAMLAGTGTAIAEAPLEVTDQITDGSGVLGDRAEAAEQAVADLAAGNGLGLYVVFVDSFGRSDATTWTRSTARMSDLHDDDLLLAVAVGQETYDYSYWIAGGFPLSEVDLERAMIAELEPRLAVGNQAGAVVALAAELQDAAQAEDEAAARSAPWSASTTMLIVGSVGGVLLLAHLLSRRRSPATPS